MEKKLTNIVKTGLVLIFLMFCNIGLAQYSSKHYIPPFVALSGSTGIHQHQFIGLSTNETVAFNVNITMGDGSVPPAGQVSVTTGTYNSATGVATISATNPLLLRIGTRNGNAITGTGVICHADINATTGALDPTSTTGYEVPSNNGIIIEASGGENFYVNA